ncbi:ATP-dependent Clp protease heat shock protein 100, putative [Bodo saltans]|uniref:ATP-dependent Clp protease heat shock protein 100, putative n=1 Tax=Bodo saltans TaxID=75058 RepID=A0A0S4J215_BODSA|nr:ATP-dependent Clp protease heat shock protein 100, putative [Bodo saltans]|eukprot:CUG83160.1 ATP-dependent Clp protease heat shock protein 100, putative [Bodo saltans]
MPSAEWTQAAQKLLSDAMALAKTNSCGFLHPFHIAAATFADQSGLPARVLQKIGCTQDVAETFMQKLRALPTQTPAPEKPTPNSEAMRILNTVEQRRVSMNDELVAVDHFLLSLHESRDVATILDAAGAKQKTIESTLIELRKGKRVTSQFQDQNYDALSKYATDLCKLAEEGKLDPVIGRDEEIRRTIRVLSRQF